MSKSTVMGLGVIKFLATMGSGFKDSTIQAIADRLCRGTKGLSPRQRAELANALMGVIKDMRDIAAGKSAPTTDLDF
jgi:hypothetical protein